MNYSKAYTICKQEGGRLHRENNVDLNKLKYHLNLWKLTESEGKIWLTSADSASMCTALKPMQHSNIFATESRFRWEESIHLCVENKKTHNVLCQINSEPFKTRQCRTGHFKCGDGSCLASPYICDGEQDCPMGEDEQNCTCDTSTFPCGDGTCLSKSLVCDFIPHCKECLDEEGCNRHNCLF